MVELVTVHRARIRLDLTGLSPQVRAVIESIMDTGEVAIVRSGEPVGTLTFQQPAVLEGVLLPPAAENSQGQVPEREDVKVVATTMLMSDAARARLRDASAPPTWSSTLRTRRRRLTSC